MVQDTKDRSSVRKMCHALSKDARKDIIIILYNYKFRSIRALARELQVSTPAVAKYLSGRTHPRDEVICRAIEIAASDDSIKREIKNIIFKDIINTLEGMLSWMLENDMLASKDLDIIASKISMYKLAMIGAPSASP